MKKTNRTLAFIFVLLCSLSAAALAEEYAPGLLDAEITLRDDYSIVVDGVEFVPDVPPVEKDGVIFIPLRFAAEALKAQVDWNDAEKSVILTKSGLKTTMRMGDTTVDTSAGETILAGAPFIFEKRTMIPLRAAAESLVFKVDETPDTMRLTTPDKAALKPSAKSAAGKPALEAEGEADSGEAFAIFRAQARKDKVTRAIRPFVVAAWVIALLMWLIKLSLAIINKNEWRDLALIGLFLAAGVPFVAWSHVMLSTWWAAIVIIGASFSGLFSTEDYEDKLVTMGSTAQGLGLICTLFGLGLVIGPAIATHNIAAIGYGIYVKIEPTITGLSLSIIMNILYGYEARKMKNQ